MFDAKQALRLIDELRVSAETLAQMPEVIPIAREIFGSVFKTNEQTRKLNAPRTMSAARRKQLSIAAKKRWRVAKRAGKNTIGGGR